MFLVDSKDNYWRLTKWIIGIVAVIYILPYILLGNNCYVRIHDNLEGEWIWLKLLIDSGRTFGIYSWEKIPQVMQGAPRNVFPGIFSVNTILVLWLGMYKAYFLSGTIIRIIGFAGMVLLLRDYFVDDHEVKETRYIVYLCALIFAVLPVYVPFGLSVMGQPLLFWAFLNLQHYKRLLSSYIIIMLFPLYASMVWFVVPFEVLLGVAIWYFYRREEISNHFIICGVLMVLIFIQVNLPMLSLSVLNPDFISHRLSYNLYMFDKPSLTASLTDFLVTFFFLHYHVANFAPLVVIIAMGLTIKRGPYILPVILFGAIIFICLFQAFYTFPEYALMDRFAFLKSFRFNRFSILLPLLWVLSFALALQTMRNSPVLKKLVLPFLLIQLSMAIFGNDEVLHDYRTLLGHQKFPNYQNYMAKDQFTAIKKYIGQPVDSYYVASLGISPSIAQYNGFYTLDGLLSIYDINYKHDFRRIFAGEIAKSKDIQQYYDGWGNRCYIFSSELGMKNDAYNSNKFDGKSISHFDFNKDAFKDMGGKYLISGVEIKNAEQTGLHLEKVFKDKTSWWTIYLYSVK
jgi:hypothetical protein